jgi:dolichol-phosphate mannosyltransferase
MNMEIGADSPPPDRRSINMRITEEINRRLRLGLTDSFCGFKAYRVSRIAEMPLTEDGYAFPMQFWVQAVALGLRVEEIPVKLIYNDPNRSFGGPLNDPTTRLRHYCSVFEHEITRWAQRLPQSATMDISGLSGQRSAGEAGTGGCSKRSCGCG